MENRFYPEPTCHACFDECKMIAMGMADPMQCDCLKDKDNPPPPPEPTTTRRPITDIDIPLEQVRDMDSFKSSGFEQFL